MHDTTLLDEFLAESRDHLEQVEKDFMALQENPGLADPECINRIFRAMHTVKGSSGFFGLTRIGSLAHGMETLLDKLRSGTLVLDRNLLDHLFTGIDTLQVMLADIHNSNAMDNCALEQRLRALAHDQEPSAALAPSSPAVLSLRQGKIALTEEIRRQVPAGQHLYQLSYNLQEMEKHRCIGPVALVEYLQTLGTILDGILETEAKGLCYHMLFTSVLERDLLLGSIHAEDEAIVEINLQTTPTPPRAAAGPEEKIMAEPAKKNVPQRDAYLKVKVDVLDRLMSLAGELVLVRNQQIMRADEFSGVARSALQQLDLVTNELQDAIMRTRMQPIGSLFTRFHRVARELGQKLGKEIQVVVSGADVELDKNILEALVDPLTHMVRNCCDHGIGTPSERCAAGKNIMGTITLEAFHEAGHIHVLVADDGQGIATDAIRRKALEKGLHSEEELAAMGENEILSLIFLPGFSTARQVTDVSGRGVGMDVVKTTIENIGGTVELQSAPGQGSTFRLKLPLTLAIIPCMIVESRGQRLAIPQISLEELVAIYDEDVFDSIECAGDQEVYRLRDTLLPLVGLDTVLESPVPFSDNFRREITERDRQNRIAAKKQYAEDRRQEKKTRISCSIVVVHSGSTRFGLRVDRILGTEEIVVKPMHPSVKSLPIYSGVTVLGDGDIALILDVQGLVRHVGVHTEAQTMLSQSAAASAAEGESLLLFHTGAEEQFAIPMQNVRRIEHIAGEKIQHIGNAEYYAIEARLMPLVRIAQLLPVQSAPDPKEMYLLLVAQGNDTIGILAHQVIDIQNYQFELDRQAMEMAGVQGVTQIQERLTIVLDISRLGQPRNKVQVEDANP